jgi:hypothetical protein
LSFILFFLFLFCWIISAIPFYQIAYTSSSHSYEIQEIISENRKWFQTCGNSDLNLKNNYTGILAVNYLSDGETLKATLWLNAGINNYTDYSYNHPLNNINYGMLIDADSNTETGHRGADYDFYVELSCGNLSAYLYLLSLTGGYKLLDSKVNLRNLWTTLLCSSVLWTLI